MTDRDDGGSYYASWQERLKGYFPYRDAQGCWRQLHPPGAVPSARDYPLGHANAPGGHFYVTLGRASDMHPQYDSRTVWAFDPGSGQWTRLPSRNAGPAAREETCSGLARRPGDSASLFAFGGLLEV